MGIPIPHTGNPVLDIIAVLIVSTAIICISVWTLWSKLSPHLKSIRKDIATTKEQVTNTHQTNLRHDLDDLGTKQNQIESKVDFLAQILERVESKLDEQVERLVSVDKDTLATREETKLNREEIRECRVEITENRKALETHIAVRKPMTGAIRVIEQRLDKLEDK